MKYKYKILLLTISIIVLCGCNNKEQKVNDTTTKVITISTTSTTKSNYKTVNVNDLKLNLPSNLIVNNNGDIHEYNLESSGDSCNLIIEVIDKGDYSSADDYMQKELSITNSSEKLINSNKWYTFNGETENGENNYYYVTVYNEKIYSLKFSLFESGSTCNSVPGLLNSTLKF